MGALRFLINWTATATATAVRTIPDGRPELGQGLDVVGEDVLHVEYHPALDQLQVLLAGEEARLGEEGGDLAGVRSVPKVDLLVVIKLKYGLYDSDCAFVLHLILFVSDTDGASTDG